MPTTRSAPFGLAVLLSLLPLAAGVFVVVHGQQEPRVTGLVTDVEGNPLAGASIAIVEPAGAPPVLADASGRFELRDLSASRFTIRVTLPGFRPETRLVESRDGTTERLTVVLRIGILSEGLAVMPEPRDALRQSTAVAHIRLDGLDAPRPCGDAAIVAAVHNASVLEVWRGALPKRIQIFQDSAGRCYDIDGVAAVGVNAVRPIGSEYVVFLNAAGNGYHGVGTGDYAFPVVRGRVTTHGVFGLADTVTLREFRSALERQRR